MSQYIMLEVMEGAYDISCPDRDCLRHRASKFLILIIFFVFSA